ncbi:RYamide receptor-like [Oculina patagonica]
MVDNVNNTNSSKISNVFTGSGSTFLLIRSYEEARNVFAIVLSVNLLVIVSGIVVNAAICYVMLRGKRYKRNSSNFFITHLSVVELVYRLLVFPIIVYFTVPASEIKSTQCKFITFFAKTSASAIFVSLVAIAADRYLNIAHPLKTLKSERKPVFLVFLVWLYAAIVSGPSVFSVDSISVLEIPEARGIACEDCADKKLCDIPQNLLGQCSTSLFVLLAFVVPLAVIFALYTKVAIFLHHRGNNGMMHKIAARSKSKAVRMLIITVFGYVLSLGPAAVLSMLRSYGALNNSSFDVMLLVSWMVDFATYTSSLGNPLIYAYYNGDFRKEILRLFRIRNDRKVEPSTVTSLTSTRNSYLVAIATDRYQNIIYPMKALKGKKNHRHLVFLVWLYATGVSIPFVLSVKSVSIFEIPEAQGMDLKKCFDMKICNIPQNAMGRVSTTVYFGFAFFVPLIIIIGLYTKIAFFLHQRSNNGLMHKVAARSKSKAVRMLTVVALAYTLSLGPTAFFAMLRSYGFLNRSSFGDMLTVSWAIEFLTLISSLGNPIIYAYYNGDFRKELLKLVCESRVNK